MVSMSEYQNCFKIRWGIEHFSCCVQQRGENLRSPLFQEESSSNQHWHLKLYPRGIQDDAHISFELCSSKPLDGIYSYTVSLVDKCGSSHFSKEIKSISFLEQLTSRIEDFIKRKDLFADRALLLPDDTITVQCTIRRPFKQLSVIESIRIEKSSFTWPIAQLSSFQPDSSNLTYPIKVDFERDNRLSLVFSTEEDTVKETHVCVIFQKISKSSKRPKGHTSYIDYDSSISISFEISMIDTNGTVIKLTNGEHIFPVRLSNAMHTSRLMKRSDLLKKKDQLLPNDTLTLAFNLKISNGSKRFSNSVMKSEYYPKPKPTPLFDMVGEKLFEMRKFCDVVLKVGNQNLQAHKAVLHSRSSVFKGMLDLDEKITVINIVDFDAVTMCNFLHLLYTGKVLFQDLKPLEMLLKLYSAAHKYQVTNFRDVLCPLLVAKITTDNIWEVLSCALKYDDDVLKEAAQSFILKHPADSLTKYKNSSTNDKDTPPDDKDDVVILEVNVDSKPKIPPMKRRKRR